MKVIKQTALFFIGGLGYVGLEYLWRGWSHISMFFAGGTCFLLLGKLSQKPMRWPVRAVAGSGIITAVELLTGLLVNRSYQVWDYRAMPLNFLGQICLMFSTLWMPVSLGATWLYRFFTGKIDKMVDFIPKFRYNAE